MTNGFGIDGREPDFYERNRNNAVNLFDERGVAFSGDIAKYDRERGIVTLANSIKRMYNPDGTSQFVESPTEMEFETSIIKIRGVTTREDRLGRIAKHNEDLRIEGIEGYHKLRELRDFIIR